MFTDQGDIFFTSQRSQRELLVWRLHYHRHKNTVKIIILNNLLSQTLMIVINSSVGTWSNLPRSPSCFTWFDHMTSEVHTKRSRVAGLNSAVVTPSCALCPLTRLSIYIVNVHQAAIRYQIILVGGYLVGIGGELVFHPEKRGWVKASHTYILVYFQYPSLSERLYSNL